MQIKTAVALFGNKARLARAIGVKPPSVTRWSQGEAVSEYHQLKIEKLTGGKCKADPDVRKKWEAVL